MKILLRPRDIQNIEQYRVDLLCKSDTQNMDIKNVASEINV